MTVYWPTLNPVVTEEPGTRGGTHTGIDLAAERGDPVLAPFDGVVVYRGGDGAVNPLWLGDRWLYPNGEGRTLDIMRSDGLFARLGHLEGYNVREGDRVTGGSTVGFAGDSGYSTGVHVHMEFRWDRVWVGGNWINPRDLSPTRYTSLAGAIEPESTPVPVPERKRNDMIGVMIVDGENRYKQGKGKKFYALFTGDRLVSLTEEGANAISVHMGKAFANLTYEDWEILKRATTREGLS